LHGLRFNAKQGELPGELRRWNSRTDPGGGNDFLCSLHFDYTEKVKIDDFCFYLIEIYDAVEVKTRKVRVNHL